MNMERFLISTSSSSSIPSLYPDFWTLLSRKCDWPELYSLTKVSHHARKAAIKELKETHQMQLFWYLIKFIETHNLTKGGCYLYKYYDCQWTWKMTLEPFHSYRSALYVIMKLCQQQGSLKGIEKYLKKRKGIDDIESFQRFARITGVVSLVGPLSKWKKKKKI